jgi:hypothetical protein
MGGIWGKQRENPYSSVSPCLELIIKAIQKSKVEEGFTLIDFCCGEGLLLEKLLTVYPKATLIGLDMNKYQHWSRVPIRFIDDDMIGWVKSDEGLTLFCDIVIMTDTWRNRGWDHLDLTDWLRKHSRFFITDISPDCYTSIPFPYEIIGVFLPYELSIVLCSIEGKND